MHLPAAFAWFSPFSMLTGVAVLFGYALLGATWLVLKTTGPLQRTARTLTRPLVLVVGMLTTKDATGFLGNFAGLARRVIAIPIAAQPNAMTADAVADVAKAAGIPAWRRDSLEDALAAVARLDLEPAPRIVITGSLYLAGEVLQANGTPPE